MPTKRDIPIVREALRLSERLQKDADRLSELIEKHGLNEIFLENDEIDFSGENMDELTQISSMAYDTEKSCVRILTEKFNVKLEEEHNE